MNRNKKKFIYTIRRAGVALLGLIILGLPGSVAGDTFNAPIEIVSTPLGALNVSFLRFGELACADDIGLCSVTITPNLSVQHHTCTSVSASSVTCNINQTGAAQYLISGAPNAFYNITLPNSTPLVDSNGNTLPFPGTNVNAISENIASTSVGQLDGSGNDRIFVGARADFFGSPTAFGATVTSNFSITLSYQ